MAEEFRADPQAIVRLAKATLAGADAMADGWSAAQGGLTPPGSAYGNSAAGPDLAAAVAGAEATMDAAWRRIGGVYEADVDRLYGVAFAYQQSDARGAARLPGASR